MEIFDPEVLKNPYKAPINSSKNDNGQVTIIGGSRLFHGAPLLALTTASRIVDMVYFATPERSIGQIAEKIKSSLFSFIWVPWEDTAEYIEKSDAILVGPGFMRETKTKKITKWFLTKFADKKWVIDAGSLQMMDKAWIPRGSILTPNQKEYTMLFDGEDPEVVAKRFGCILVIKGPTTYVYGPNLSREIRGGNPGLTKGGTGDVQAGLTVALLAKNEPFATACAASYLVKKAADELYERAGTNFNSDDLANEIPEALKKFRE